jgi:hypothetical protein
MTSTEANFNEWYRADLFLAESDELAALKRAYEAGAASQARTLRDEFAGRAMQGILSGMDLSTMPPYEEFGPFCYRLADAMLKARKTTGEGEA